jgi:hypothetical protein
MSLFEGIKLSSVFKAVAVGTAASATMYAYNQDGMPLAGAAVPGFGAGIMAWAAADTICQKVRKHFYREP